MSIHSTTFRTSSRSMKSPFVWRCEWGVAQVKPEPVVFERYGICGDCQVPCRDGMTKIRDLTSKKKIITRRHGFVSAVGLLWNGCFENSEETEVRVGIPAGSFGGDLPQKPVILGSKSKVSRYISTANSRRLSSVTVELDNLNGHEILKSCPSGDLFVPVFSEVVEISVEGIYISCPTMFDLRTKIEPAS